MNVVVNDFNGDGVLDLATPSYGDYYASVLLGRGEGTFSEARNYSIGVGTHVLLTGDFNGDGRPDLIAVNSSSWSISFLAGNGDGRFAPQFEQYLDSSGVAGAVADFDADGKLDVAVAHYNPKNAVSVLHGNGDGSFGREASYAVGSHPFFVAAADFNGDRRTDLVVVNFKSESLSVLLGTAQHTFVAAPDHQLHGRAVTLSVADLNRDGVLDLLVPTVTVAETAQLEILLGAGNGTFRLRNTYSTEYWCIGLDVADFNGDGKLDVLTGSFATTALRLFYGNGRGSFNSEAIYELGTTTRAVTAGDFNRDGKPDFVASLGFDFQDSSGPSTNLVVVLNQTKHGKGPRRPPDRRFDDD